MTNIKQYIPNLLGGISQAPITVRNLNQCTEMENCTPSHSKGLVKRPPSEHVGSLGVTPAIAKYHVINRSTTEQFLVGTTPTGVTVMDLSDGSDIAVTETASFNYLSGIIDEDNVELLSIADTTFIVNKKSTTAMDTTTTPATSTQMEGAAFLIVGDPSSHYAIELIVDGSAHGPYDVDTWDGAAATGSQIASIQSQVIMEQFKTLINADGANNVTAARKGSVISLKVSAAQTLIVNAEDSQGDSSLIVFTDKAPRVNGYLPAICEDGHIVNIIGDAEIEADDYYVKFTAEDTTADTFGKGYWEETAASEILLEPKPSTMPHILVGDTGGFAFETVDWGDRTVGDTSSKSNPNPSFINRRIRNLFFYKDRLGFLVGPRVIMSEQGEYYNFFRTTLLELLDGDPIDIETNHTKQTNFREYAYLDGDLMLFTKHSQFVLKGAEILSPRTIQLVPVTEYPYDLGPAPVSTGFSIIFPFKKGQQAGLREEFKTSNETYQGVEITLDVPDLIPGSIDHMALSPLENILVVKTDNAATSNTIWVFNFLWSGEEKIQAAWGTWTFGSGAVKFFEFIENDLYVVIERNGNSIVEKIKVSTGLSDTGSEFKVLLDRRITEADATISYDSVSDETRVQLPYTLENAGGDAAIVNATGFTQYQINSGDSTDIYIRGNASGDSLFIGETYEQKYVFSPPIIKKQVSKSDLAGEYIPPQKVRYATIQLSETRYLKATVEVDHKPTYEYEFNGLTSDEGDPSLDSIILFNDGFRIPIQGNAPNTTITVTNNTPYPANLTSAVYLINYILRGRTI